MGPIPHPAHRRDYSELPPQHLEGLQSRLEQFFGCQHTLLLVTVRREDIHRVHRPVCPVAELQLHQPPEQFLFIQHQRLVLTLVASGGSKGWPF